MQLRTLAVDWSGAASGAKSTIWLAEACDGQLVQLENGRSRAELASHLIAEADRTPHVVVGLDFAFSLPSWFLDARSLASAHALWDLAATDAEEWLARCEPPFWGRPGRRRPILQDELRRTERSLPPIAGIRAKSTFQIGGAGAVGTGSLRGMPILGKLSTAGFAIWPFDAPRFPLVIEIYPRLLTGAVNKGDFAARQTYLEVRFPALDGSMAQLAASTEDAFDAAVSALIMDEHRNELLALETVDEPQLRLEGKIWHPAALTGVDTIGTGAFVRHAGASGIDSAKWKELVRTMLPSPVREGPADTLIGGDPGEVVALVTDAKIVISKFAIRWDGHVPEVDPSPVSTFDRRTANPRNVSRAVTRARTSRLGTYRWCAHCRSMNPPEWLINDELCQSCGEKHFGVVF